MKNRKDSVILIICTVILLVSVSYSWMLGKENQTVKSIQMDYTDEKNLTIASADSVRLSVLYKNSRTGQYEEWDPEDLSSLRFFDGMLPGGSVDFKLRFFNLSDTVQNVRLSVGGIKNTTEGVELENSLVPQMYISVTPGKGFADTSNGDVVIPDQIFLCLGDNRDGNRFIDGVGSQSLYGSLTVPPTGSPDSGIYAELDCYFWLDRNASGDFQDMTMDIGYFRVSQ